MALVMVDLDNTLVNRAQAVERWADAFVEQQGGSADDVRWIIAADRDGLEPRESFAAAAIHRTKAPLRVDDVVEQLRHHLISADDLTPGVLHALEALRSHGHRVVCVTNGTTTGQQATLAATRLTDAFDAVLISEQVGCKKPSPEIFHLAASTVGTTLEGSWMVGDSPTSDVVGAAKLGCATAWLARGRVWPSSLEPPTATVEDPAAALRLVLGRL